MGSEMCIRDRDFREVQNPVLVGALDRPAFDRTQLCLFILICLFSSLRDFVVMSAANIKTDCKVRRFLLLSLAYYIAAESD